jgi:hypothetical protein
MTSFRSNFFGVDPGFLVKECRYSTGFRMSLVASMLYFVISVLVITVPQTGALQDKRLNDRTSKKDRNTTSSGDEKEEISVPSKQCDEPNSRCQSPHMDKISETAEEMIFVEESDDEDVNEMASFEQCHTDANTVLPFPFDEDHVSSTMDDNLPQEVESI